MFVLYIFYRGQFFWAQNCETLVKNQALALQTQREAMQQSDFKTSADVQFGRGQTLENDILWKKDLFKKTALERKMLQKPLENTAKTSGQGEGQQNIRIRW